MPIISPDAGEALLLSYMLNKTPPANVRLHLFTSPTTAPTESILLSDITEAADASYVAPALAGASWTITTTSGVTTASYPEVTFTFAGAQSVFGYYVTDGANTTVLWIERFSGAPFTLPSGGGTIAITPKITLD